MSSGHKNKVIFEKSYPGGWVKKLVESNRVERTQFQKHRPDPYLISPTGKKLRSNKELLDFIINHPEYWNTFDPLKINLVCTPEILTKPTKGTRPILDFLKNIRSGKFQIFFRQILSLMLSMASNYDNLILNFRHDTS